jgi:hypothetical protein
VEKVEDVEKVKKWKKWAAIIVLTILPACVLACAQDEFPARTYWTAVSMTAGLVAADGYTTVTRNRAPSVCPWEVGSPFLYSRDPQPGRLVLTLTGELALTSAVSYFLARHSRTRYAWFAPFAYEAIIHGHGAVHNLVSCH